jgi:hypothetical protein
VGAAGQRLGEGAGQEIDVIWQWVYLSLVNNAIAGKAAVYSIADDLAVGAHVVVAQPALETATARPGCRLARNPVAWVQVLYALAQFDDHTGKLVADDHRGLDVDRDFVVIDV